MRNLAYIRSKWCPSNKAIRFIMAWRFLLGVNLQQEVFLAVKPKGWWGLGSHPARVTSFVYVLVSPAPHVLNPTLPYCTCKHLWDYPIRLITDSFSNARLSFTILLKPLDSFTSNAINTSAFDVIIMQNSRSISSGICWNILIKTVVIFCYSFPKIFTLLYKML